MKKRHLLLVLLAALTLPAMAQNNTPLERAIQRQMANYPAATLADYYKLFFQDAFGPGHLMADTARAAAYLRAELQQVQTDPDPGPEYAATGYRGRYYRVNLSVIAQGKVPFSTFLSAFVQSAQTYTLPSIEEWSAEWAEIQSAIRTLNPQVPNYEADSIAIQALLSSGRYAAHHSAAYNAAYHPHYRLIERRIFEQQILPLLAPKQ